MRLGRVSERAGLLLVLGGLAATALAPFLRWQSDYALLATSGYSGDDGSGAVPVALVFVLGPLASGWVLAARLPRRVFAEDRGYRRVGRSGWPIAAAVILCALGVDWSVPILAPARGPGGPLLVAGSGALVLGWLALAAGPRRPGRARVPAPPVTHPEPAPPVTHPDPGSAPGDAAAPAGGVTCPPAVAAVRRTWASAAVAALVPAVVGAVVISQVSVLNLTDHTTAAALPAIRPASLAALRLSPPPGCGRRGWATSWSGRAWWPRGVT